MTEKGLRDFQALVQDWMIECFWQERSSDIFERTRRFLEESLELIQSLGTIQEEEHQPVDYVFARSVGELNQELSGVIVTLAPLCHPSGLRMVEDSESELDRISLTGVIAKIRAMHSRKPKD